MQEIRLSQNTFSLFPSVYAVQNDTGRELKMVLTDQTLLATDMGALAVNRSDGSYYTISGTVDTATNSVTADISQALTQPGRTFCQLKITDTNDLVVSSYTFCIMVQPSTDGIQESQLGYSVQQLRQDAIDIRTGGMPADLRLALLQIAQKVAYIDENGQQYYQDLYDALAPSAILTGISAVYTQSGTVYDTDTLDSLKADLVVTASYSDGTSETLPGSVYSLSGTLEAGTSTITVTYETQSDTFSVTVTANPVPAEYEIVDFITSAVHGTPAASHLTTTPYIKTLWPAENVDIWGYSFGIEFMREFTNVSCCPFGGRNAKTASNTTQGTVLIAEVNGNETSLIFGNNGGSCIVTKLGTDFAPINTKTKLEVRAGSIYINDVFFAQITGVSAVQSASYQWGLGGRNNQGSWTANISTGGDLIPMIGRLYSFWMKDGNGDYVFNYVPCKRKADTVFGMFETVSQTFYTSAISTAFSGGNE